MALETTSLLTSLGHQVEEKTPEGMIAPELFPVFNVLYAAGIASSIEDGAELKGRAPKADDVEAMSWGFYQYNKALSPASYFGAVVRLQQQARTIINSL